MPELAYRDQSSSSRSAYRAREASPDSVIFTPESNFSLFSSASASVDRCSFASDAQDRDSLVSDFSLHLGGQDRDGGSSCTDPEPNKLAIVPKHSRSTRKIDKAKGVALQKAESDGNTEDENQRLDSARSSFSLALKECQERRTRSEVLAKKLDRQRTASLDLNNVTSSSPRLVNMKKTSVSTRKSNAFPIPGTPTYRHASIGMQKGWSSERVPLHSNGGKRQVNTPLLHLNTGRTLPSKWEDAERWILSPVAQDAVVRTSFAAAHERKPKSKSGPLGPPGLAYHLLYSPAVPVFEHGSSMGSFMAGSPISAGVVAAGGSPSGAAFPVRTDPCIARSVSVHGCSESLAPPLLPSQDTDEILDSDKDVATNISRAVSRRDMATQMSPAGSTRSSTDRRLSFSASNPSALRIVELQSACSSKSEIGDLQVDGRVSVTRWSRKHRSWNRGKSSVLVDNWSEKAVEAQASTWVTREEARITAWENLQKAKAEAAIRKLEMKLEKKRSSSMEKIMKKLRSAQKRAQDMRSSVLADNAHQVSETSHKAISFRRTRQMASLSGCFTCHAF